MQYKSQSIVVEYNDKDTHREREEPISKGDKDKIKEMIVQVQVLITCALAELNEWLKYGHDTIIIINY